MEREKKYLTFLYICNIFYNKIVQHSFRFLNMKRLFSPFLYGFLMLSPLLLPSQAYGRGDSESRPSDTDTHYAAIIKIDSEDAVSSLTDAGVEILRRRDNLLLCYIPVSLDIFSETRCERGFKIERGRKVSRSMDKAREWFNADYIHSGRELPMPYTGEGVVTGICDVGIDPLHISFLDADGEPRIKRIVQYKEGTGERIVLHSKDDYTAWVTDTPDNWHATHVANIMAGSYGPYKGMAPGSEMVITTSQLTDVGLLCGAEDILEYAQENGKRAVINMSMANYIGPHDGSALFSQYLAKIGEEAIVVLSAGNGGRKDFTLPFDFTDTARTTSLALYSTDWVQFNPYGATDVWSIDDTPLQVRFGIQDAQQQTIFKMFPWQELYEGNTFVVTSDPDRLPASNRETVIYDEDFAHVYSGWFSLTGEINPENGRYRMIMEYDAHTDHVASQGPWARYVPVIEVSGAPGAHADIYGDFQYTVFRAMPGGAQPGSILSFSDLASGENVISVGMFVNRNTRPSVSGDDYTDDVAPGTIWPGSSYSTLNDGRVMPITVAPGYSIVSAISNPFYAAHPTGPEQINAETTVNGKQYFWATNSGTSMSAPYVAGTLACWLEALPGLTTKDIIRIMADTNRHDYPDPENPRHGQGWFNPLEGLKTALKAYSGITDINGAGDKANYDNRKLTFSGSILSLWNPEMKDTRIFVTDISGQVLLSLESSFSMEEISLSHFVPGIYLAHIEGSNKSLKFLLL